MERNDEQPRMIKLDAAVLELLSKCSRKQLIVALLCTVEKLTAAFEDQRGDALTAQEATVAINVFTLKALDEAGRKMLAMDADAQQREPTAEEQERAKADADAAIAKARGGAVPGNGTVH